MENFDIEIMFSQKNHSLGLTACTCLALDLRILFRILKMVFGSTPKFSNSTKMLWQKIKVKTNIKIICILPKNFTIHVNPRQFSQLLQFFLMGLQICMMVQHDLFLWTKNSCWHFLQHRFRMKM